MFGLFPLLGHQGCIKAGSDLLIDQPNDLFEVFGPALATKGVVVAQGCPVKAKQPIQIIAGHHEALASETAQIVLAGLAIFWRTMTSADILTGRYGSSITGDNGGRAEQFFHASFAEESHIFLGLRWRFPVVGIAGLNRVPPRSGRDQRILARHLPHAIQERLTQPCDVQHERLPIVRLKLVLFDK